MGRPKKQQAEVPETVPETLNIPEQEPRTSEGEIVPDDDDDDAATLDKIGMLQREVSQLKKELAWAYKNMELKKTSDQVTVRLVPNDPNGSTPPKFGPTLTIKELNELGRSATRTGLYSEAIQSHEDYLKSGEPEQVHYVAQALNQLRMKQAKAKAQAIPVTQNQLQQFTRR